MGRIVYTFVEVYTSCSNKRLLLCDHPLIYAKTIFDIRIVCPDSL